MSDSESALVRARRALISAALGALLAPSATGDAREALPAPDPFLLEETHYDVVVKGPVVQATVSQSWRNPNESPVDGLYVFPLPHDAAVSDMRIEIGDRVIRADIKRREDARQIYEMARMQGRIAGLLDQERPNVFAQRIANLMPGASIRVVIAYEEPLASERGKTELVVPTVVGPRFVPVHQTDPGDILPPIDLSSTAAARHKLTFRAALDTGVPLATIGSPTHNVSIEREGSSRARVTIDAAQAEILDRDVRLIWTTAGEKTELGAIAWREPEKSKTGAFTLVIEPPAVPASEAITPRELVFVLDCSGSMDGAPLAAAREVVRRTLAALQPRDTFTILRFSDRASGLSTSPLANTPENVKRALAYLDTLRGGGGTMMIEGIRAALGRQAEEGHLRIIAFLTDGYIGNEREIFAEVRRSLGQTRLFAFGVGSSVNRYLLEGLAEEGRGAALFQSPREAPASIVEDFVRRIGAPVLTDVRVSFEDLSVSDLEPGLLPDLFAGQPLVLHGRYDAPSTGVVTVEGKQAGVPVRVRRIVTLPDRAEDGDAIGRLWARARIHRLHRETYDSARADVTERIVALALEHRLVTEYTSFVAVDSEISNRTGTSHSVNVPIELPQDVPLSAIGSNATLGMALRAPIAREGQHFFMDSGVGTRGGSGRRVESELYTCIDDSPEPDEIGPALGATFSVRFERSDGSAIVVEEDGEMWLERGTSLNLVRALGATELDTLRRLVSALPAGVAKGPQKVRFVIASGGVSHVIPFQASGDAGRALRDQLDLWMR